MCISSLASSVVWLLETTASVLNVGPQINFAALVSLENEMSSSSANLDDFAVATLILRF